MRLSGLVLGVIACQNAAAHSLFTTLFVNDVNQGDGTCVRMPRNPATSTDPVLKLQGEEMMCGFDGDEPVDRVCSVPRSAKLSFLTRSWPDGTQPGSIDKSHIGPCAVYMRAQDLSSEWFKIWDEGYDQETSQWCSEKIIQNNGLFSVKIPSDLVGTSYLVRFELLSLQQADKNPPQPQFYIGCAQIFLNSTATALPSETVKIPGHVSIKNPSLLFNIYESNGSSYLPPGPERYVSGISPSTKADPQPAQQDGLLPANAILTNGNWWGVEVPSWNDEMSCRKASRSCFAQLETCYNTAPPTGSKGCRIWEAKCDAINDNCNSASPNGPKAGKPLGTAHQIYSIPPAAEVDGTTAVSKATSKIPTTLIPVKLSTPTQNAPATVIDSTAGSLIEIPKVVPSVTLAPTTSKSQEQQVAVPETSISTSATPQNTITVSITISPSTSILPTTTSTSSTISSTMSTTLSTLTSSTPLPTSTSISTSSTSTSSTSTSAKPTKPLSTYPPSLNDRCGQIGNMTSCMGNPYGRCCSKDCRCGTKKEHCGSLNCQPHFGECGDWLPQEEEEKERQKRRDRLLEQIVQSRKRSVRMKRYWGL